MKGNGWIKLYRVIEQSNVWDKPSDWLKIWLLDIKLMPNDELKE